MQKSLTYKTAGVDIDLANASVNLIKQYVKDTYNKYVLAGVGPFGSMFDLGSYIKDYKHPILVQSIDGVGTKLIIANMMERFTTIGIDMVAHSCNDVVCQGARPITFFDYIASSKLNPIQLEEIIKGICIGCREADLPLMGGETAELPGIYMNKKFDLVGAVTGIVELEEMINGNSIIEGDVIIGLSSNGLHTNGYSLARKILFSLKGYKVTTKLDDLDLILGEELLKPHINYSKLILKLIKLVKIKGIAHITGGGLIDNIPRILPIGLRSVIKSKSWVVPSIFNLLKREGDVEDREMFRTFNMGIGIVLLVAVNNVDKIKELIHAEGMTPYEIGVIFKSDGPGHIVDII